MSATQPSATFDPAERFNRGYTTFKEITGISSSVFLDRLKEVAPDFGRLIMEGEFADVYGRPGLDWRTRELIIIAACAALGATGVAAVKLHTATALRAGVSPQEIVEVLIQVRFAAGLPAALGALAAVGEILTSHARTAGAISSTEE